MKNIFNAFVRLIEVIILIALFASIFMIAILQYGLWSFFIIPAILISSMIFISIFILGSLYMRYVISTGHIRGFSSWLEQRGENEEKIEKAAQAYRDAKMIT